MKANSFFILASVFVLAALLMTSGIGVMAQGPLPPSLTPTPQSPPLPPEGSLPQGGSQQGGNSAQSAAQSAGGSDLTPQTMLSPETIASSSFTYQGQLKKSTGPVTDSCSMAFRLYDAASAGTLVAGPLTTTVPITGGLFTVQLNWGGGYYTVLQGDDRWLDIAVKCSADSTYAALSPRQQITGAPYAFTLRPGANIVGNLPNWSAIYASNVATTSYSYGIRTQSNSPWGRGLSAESYYTGGMGVYGYSVPGGGAGVAGYIGNDNLDVYTFGSQQYGVYGYAGPTSGTNYGVYGKSNSGSGYGVYGSAPTYGVKGNATSSGASSYGVWGDSDSLNNQATGGRFIAGSTSSGSASDGVVGMAYGQNNQAYGVAGWAYYNGVGVGAWSYSGNIIEGYDSDYPYTSTRRLYLTQAGNLYIDGTYNTFVATSEDKSGAEYRALTAVQSPEAWYEDFGKATLVNGKVVVTIEPVFARTVDTSVDYHVYVTPLCSEAVLLFVSNKNAQGFTVQGVTLDGKPSQCAFDYRIVAKPVGQENTRLPTVAGPVKANDPAPEPRPAKSEPPASSLPGQGH